MPFISICIPAYKRSQYLNRLLNSIVIQSYADYEVIVTDDSPDNEVKDLVKSFSAKISIRYHKNESTLGTPANWNAGIRLAKGTWIKLMHDDDWFADASSLQQFADATLPGKSDFIFSAYCNVDENAKTQKIVFPEKFRLKRAMKEPAVLLAKNFIGHPSVTLHKNDGKFMYDTKLKWLVDIDMYRMRMEEQGFYFIPKALINIGISDTQVTAFAKNNSKVEVPEHFHFLEKMGVEKLKNILVYDYNWRFIRNFNIRSANQLREFGFNGEVPTVLQSMISIQSKIPRSFLKIGVFSKLIMFLHFIMNAKLIKNA